MNLSVSPALAPERADLLAALCKAGGDPLRLKVLRALSNDSFGVLELAQIFAIGQSGMSHHLKVLAQAGLVATRREGNAIFYRRSLPQGALHAGLLEEVDALELDAGERARVAAVHDRRAQASRAFFARVADDFRASQELIANLSHYRDGLLSLLDALDFDTSATCIEVGPGDGAFLPELARRFARVIALDNSEVMLEQARRQCEEKRLENVELRLADVLRETPAKADCVVMNMVLHHFPAPAEAMHRLAALVNGGGSLLISELCSHDQSWARTACGDLWLGFEQEDLARWAGAAGLVPGESLYLGLKNGFQIQLRHFAKPDAKQPLE